MNVRKRERVVIEGVQPEIDCGRFPINLTVGETVAVEADIFTDGRDALADVLRYRSEDEPWAGVPIGSRANDRCRGEFSVTDLGRYRYTIRAWIDHFGTWRRDLAKKAEAGLDVSAELLIGAEMVVRAGPRWSGAGRRKLRLTAGLLEAEGKAAIEAALDPELTRLMHATPERRHMATRGTELEVVADRECARFGALYELFPHSTSLRVRG